MPALFIAQRLFESRHRRALYSPTDELVQHTLRVGGCMLAQVNWLWAQAGGQRPIAATFFTVANYTVLLIDDAAGGYRAGLVRNGFSSGGGRLSSAAVVV